MRTANRELADRAIRHAVALERLKAHEAAEVAEFLAKEVVPDVLEKLERAAARGLTDERRLAELAQQLLATMRAGLRAAGSAAETRLVEIALTESEWQRAVIRQALPVVDVALRAPSVSIISTIVKSRPLEGQVLRDWFDDVAVGTTRRITRELKVGLSQGETVDELVRRVRGAEPDVFESAFGGEGTLQQANRSCRSVVRTAVSQVTNDAREETYKLNTDVVDKVQIVATLDMRTTDICRSQDGKVYPVDSGPRPPFHFGCRTVTVPVTKSWADLKLSTKARARPDLQERASMDGQVAASVTYPQWLKSQPAAVQDEVLGPRRAELFRSGRVTIERFTDDGGRRLSLKELRRREGL